MAAILAHSEVPFEGETIINTKLIHNDGERKIVIMITDGERKEHFSVSTSETGATIRNGHGEVRTVGGGSVHLTRDGDDILVQGVRITTNILKQMLLGAGISDEKINEYIASIPAVSP